MENETRRFEAVTESRRLEAAVIQRHRRVTDGYVRKLFHDQLRRAVTGVVSGGLYGAALAAALGFVGWRALHGLASLGDVALAVQVTRMALGQVQAATRNAAWLAELSFVGERYLWLLDYRPAIQVRPPGEAAPAPAAIRRGISLEHVSFVYPGTEARVLDDVTLCIPAETTVAVVGENGAGKTSLVKLLCRFYDPTNGRILVDGVDLRDLDLEGWRARIGVAFQDFVRFQLLAREAVGVGDLEAVEDLQRVASSAYRAGADRVIERLPQGFDTQLGRWFSGGVDLSDGEWQRIALARGLMRDDPLLVILDEPTASLDARAEHDVFERFARMARPKEGPAPITLLVSHRFSTVRMADLIVGLHQGRIDPLRRDQLDHLRVRLRLLLDDGDEFAEAVGHARDAGVGQAEPVERSGFEAGGITGLGNSSLRASPAAAGFFWPTRPGGTDPAPAAW